MVRLSPVGSLLDPLVVKMCKSSFDDSGDIGAVSEVCEIGDDDGEVAGTDESMI